MTNLRNTVVMWLSYLLYKVGCWADDIWEKHELDWAYDLYVWSMRASAHVDFTYNLGIWEDTDPYVDLNKEPEFFNGL